MTEQPAPGALDAPVEPLVVTPEYFARLQSGEGLPEPPEALLEAMEWASTRIDRTAREPLPPLREV